MTQTEVVAAMERELGETISQAYLSQLESGKRVHLTAFTRDLLARFFKVHPGYLVSDPPDFSTDLLTDVAEESDRLSTWLEASAEEWRAEPEVAGFFTALARTTDPRRYLALLSELLALPLAELEQLVRTLATSASGSGSAEQELAP
ncbi:transcriptional regulator [Thermogemmatispora sp.]|uniref:transcriptional regulator n=1 Tax=Thermogemmatispora sp. TaxID=1968838 RepID=UPI0035E41EFA